MTAHREISTNSQPPSEDEIIVLLKGFKPQPRPRFYRKIQQAPWFRSQDLTNHRIFFPAPAFRWGAIALFSFLLLVSLVAAIPSLRSNASRLFHFFSPYDENWRSIQAIFTPTSISIPLPETQFPLSLAEARKQAGFTPKEITLLPESVLFDGSAFSIDRAALILHYTGVEKTILLTQRKAESVQEYASIGPTAPVQVVELRGTQAEYVSGGWVVEKSPPPDSPPNTIYLVWDDQSTMRTLRWQEDDFIYEIVTNSPEPFSLTEILAIAESMR
jgi:hypothetical protein